MELTTDLSVNVSDVAGNAANEFTKSFLVDKTNPVINSITIASNNDVSTTAKHGDTVTITINTDASCNEPTVAFQSGGNDVSDSTVTYSEVNAKQWTAAYDVSNSDTDGIVSVNVSVIDLAGNTSSGTTITGDNVTVDTTKPVIKTVDIGWGSILNMHEDDDSQNITINMTNDDASGQKLIVGLNSVDYSGVVDYSNIIISIPAADLQALSNNTQYDITVDVSDNAGNLADRKTETFNVNKNPPTITTTLKSKNANTELKAKVDDTVELTMVMDVSTNKPDVVFKSDGQDVSGTITYDPSAGEAKTWKASFDVSATHVEGNVTIDVSAISIEGDAVNQTLNHTTITNGSVEIDLTKPVISGITFDWGTVLNMHEDDVSGTATVTTTGVEDNQVLTIELCGNTINTDYSGVVLDNSVNIVIPASHLQDLTGAAGTSYDVSANVNDLVGHAADELKQSFTINKTPPAMSYVEMTSNVADFPQKAGVGKTVTLDIVSTEDLSKNSIDVTFKSNGVDISGSSTVAYKTDDTDKKKFTASFDVSKNGNDDGDVTFSMDFTSDITGNTTYNYTTLSGDTVEVDTVKPTVSIASGVFPPINEDHNTSVTLGFTTVGAEDGQKVTMTLDSTDFISSDIASNACQITVLPAFLKGRSNGTYTATFTVTDQAGNTSDIGSSNTFGVDTFDPSYVAISITSDSTDNNGTDVAYAKAGDKVTLDISASEAISTDFGAGDNQVVFKSGGAAIKGDVSYNTVSSNRFTAAYDVSNGDTEGAVTFEIVLQDAFGNTRDLESKTVTDSTSVTIDLTKPVIAPGGITSDITFGWEALKGSGQANVLNMHEDDISQNITVVTSGAEDNQVMSLSIVDQLGSEVVTRSKAVSSNSVTFTISGEELQDMSHNYTYTTNTNIRDKAGNAAVTKSKNFTVDMSPPGINEVTVVSDNSFNSLLAKAGDTITLKVEIDSSCNIPNIEIASGGKGISAERITISGELISAGEYSERIWTAKYDISNGDTDGNITVSVDCSQNAEPGNSTYGFSTITGSTVRVDTTKPVISSVDASSNNSLNPLTYATTNDKVTILITTAEDLSGIKDVVIKTNASDTIKDTESITISGEKKEWDVSFDVSKNDVTGPLDITFTAVDLAANETDYTGGITDPSAGEESGKMITWTWNSLHDNSGGDLSQNVTSSVTGLVIDNTPPRIAYVETSFEDGFSTFDSRIDHVTQTIAASDQKITATVDKIEIGQLVTFDISENIIGGVSESFTEAVDASGYAVLDLSSEYLSGLRNNRHVVSVSVVDKAGNYSLNQANDVSGTYNKILSVDHSGALINNVGIASNNVGKAGYTNSGTSSLATWRDASDVSGDRVTLTYSVIASPSVFINATGVEVIQTHANVNGNPVVTFYDGSGDAVAADRVTYSNDSNGEYQAYFDISENDVSGVITWSLTATELDSNQSTYTSSSTGINYFTEVTIDHLPPVLSISGAPHVLTPENQPHNGYLLNNVQVQNDTSIQVVNTEKDWSGVVHVFLKTGDYVDDPDKTGTFVTDHATGDRLTTTKEITGGSDNIIIDLLKADLDFSNNLTDGNDYHWYAESTDLAGNLGSAGLNFTVDRTPPAIVAEIVSDNAINDNWAKNGDTITLTMTMDASTNKPDVTFKSHNVVINSGVTYDPAGGVSNKWTASYNVTGGDTDGEVSISIDVNDLANNPTNGYTTISGDTVTVDKVAPSVTTELSGNNFFEPTTLITVGNTVKLSMLMDASTNQPTVTFKSDGDVLGGEVTYTNTDARNWIASCDICKNDTDGNITIDLSVNDLADNWLSGHTTINTNPGAVSN